MSDRASTLRRAGCALGCLLTVGLPALAVVAIAAVPVGFRGWAAAREDTPAAALAPSTGRFVEAAGLSVFIQERGPTDGPVVLLIPGTSAWSGTWVDVSAALAEAGYRAVALDLPPFGFSDRPDPPRYDRPHQAARIWAVADAIGADRVVLIGHSFGGGPTLEAALVDPRRTTALVLVDGAISLDAGPPGPAADLARIPWVAELGVASTFQNPWVTRAVVESMVHDPSRVSDVHVARYQAPFAVAGTTPAIARWLPELADPDRAARSLDAGRIANLQVPTLLAWGREDAITPPDQARRLDQLLPDAEIAWLDGVGHLPQVEDPDALNAAILAFLARTAPP